MPPEDEPTYAMTDIQRKTLVGWISTEMNKASFVRRNTTDHTSFRRLTKAEYNFALQDLLGLPYAIGHSLPTETASEDGFIKNSEMLQMSAMQFATYRKLALEALRRVTVLGPRPTPIVYDISMQDEMNRHTSAKNAKVFKSTDDDFKNQQRRQHFFNPQTGDGVTFSNGSAKPIKNTEATPIPEESSTGTTAAAVLVMSPSNETKWNLDRFLPDEGTMRVSIRAGRTTMNPNEHTSLRLISAPTPATTQTFQPSSVIKIFQ